MSSHSLPILSNPWIAFTPSTWNAPSVSAIPMASDQQMVPISLILWLPASDMSRPWPRMSMLATLSSRPNPTMCALCVVQAHLLLQALHLLASSVLSLSLLIHHPRAGISSLVLVPVWFWLLSELLHSWSGSVVRPLAWSSIHQLPAPMPLTLKALSSNKISQPFLCALRRPVLPHNPALVCTNKIHSSQTA